MISFFLGGCQGSEQATIEPTYNIKETQTARAETTNAAISAKTQAAATQTEEAYRSKMANTEIAIATSTETYRRLSQACSGEPVAETASYAGERIHPVAIIDLEGDKEYGTVGTSWSARVPSQWAPESFEDTQLVACIVEEEVVELQVCHYFPGPDITRSGYWMKIQLFEAASGRMIGQTEFIGAPPRECKTTEQGIFTIMFGDFIQVEDVLNWLLAYVEE